MSRGADDRVSLESAWDANLYYTFLFGMNMRCHCLFQKSAASPRQAQLIGNVQEERGGELYLPSCTRINLSSLALCQFLSWRTQKGSNTFNTTFLSRDINVYHVTLASGKPQLKDWVLIDIVKFLESLRYYSSQDNIVIHAGRTLTKDSTYQCFT